MGRAPRRRPTPYPSLSVSPVPSHSPCPRSASERGGRRGGVDHVVLAREADQLPLVQLVEGEPGPLGRAAPLILAIASKFVLLPPIMHFSSPLRVCHSSSLRCLMRPAATSTVDTEIFSFRLRPWIKSLACETGRHLDHRQGPFYGRGHSGYYGVLFSGRSLLRK